MATTINWPSTIPAPTYPFECEYENNSIISKFEDGSQQSRRKFTRSRRKWTPPPPQDDKVGGPEAV